MQTNISLPQEFYERMSSFFAIDKSFFDEYFTHPANRGIRINTLKASDEILNLLPFEVKQSGFAEESYIITSDAQGIGLNPLHHAGAYYVQEPSASSAVCALDVHSGHYVLDLCAAPGGKSTQIAAKLGNTGLIWSNEYVKARTKPLISNLERMGVRNSVVSCCDTKRLCESLSGFFDRVLVDAPCSGEGMIRKEPQSSLDWSVENIEACAKRQLEILNNAALAVKQDGIMVYSTCTFAPEENELCIHAFLSQHDDFELLDSGLTFGQPGYTKFSDKFDMSKTRRIFPFHGGEGHFVAVLKRKSYNACAVSVGGNGAKKDAIKLADELYSGLFSDELYGSPAIFGDKLRLLPKDMPNVTGCGVICAGVEAGIIKQKRIEPCHGLYMAAKPESIVNKVNLDCGSSQAAAFLRGESIDVPETKNGWMGVLINGITVGFGKAVNGVLKNHYPKGLRNNII